MNRMPALGRPGARLHRPRAPARTSPTLETTLSAFGIPASTRSSAMRWYAGSWGMGPLRVAATPATARSPPRAVTTARRVTSSYPAGVVYQPLRRGPDDSRGGSGQVGEEGRLGRRAQGARAAPRGGPRARRPALGRRLARLPLGLHPTFLASDPFPLLDHGEIDEAGQWVGEKLQILLPVPGGEGPRFHLLGRQRE